MYVNTYLNPDMVLTSDEAIKLATTLLELVAKAKTSKVNYAYTTMASIVHNGVCNDGNEKAGKLIIRIEDNA